MTGYSLAQRDGERGRGGCRLCDSYYEIVYVGNGIAHLKVAHELACPLIADQIRDFLTNRDPGDEQPAE